jgi:DNA-directed RNA polymerase subunit M
MEFCECGSLMYPQGDKLVCRKCGKSKPKTGGMVVVSGPGLQKKEIPVFDLQKQKDKIATIDEPCPKCKARETMWQMIQTRGTDEPATRFFRCLKCGHTWREYA